MFALRLAHCTASLVSCSMSRSSLFGRRFIDNHHPLLGYHSWSFTIARLTTNPSATTATTLHQGFASLGRPRISSSLMPGIVYPYARRYSNRQPPCARKYASAGQDPLYRRHRHLGSALSQVPARDHRKPIRRFRDPPHMHRSTFRPQYRYRHQARIALAISAYKDDHSHPHDKATCQPLQGDRNQLRKLLLGTVVRLTCREHSLE